MIYNCNSCCKSISTKSEICPYCKADCAEISLLIESAVMERERGTLAKASFNLKSKFKGSLVGFKL
jgi:hypothetical protein